MEISEDSFREAIRLASCKWENGIPIVRARLRLAVNQLVSQGARLDDADELFVLVTSGRYERFKKIIESTDMRAFAFAVRDAR
jgi:hypothetical protein